MAGQLPVRFGKALIGQRRETQAWYELGVSKNLWLGLLGAQRGRLGGSLEEIKAGVRSATLTTQLL